jgi:hypothetical protein
MPAERDAPSLADKSQHAHTLTSCTITYINIYLFIYLLAFKIESALKSYLHKLDDDAWPSETDRRHSHSQATLTRAWEQLHVASHVPPPTCPVHDRAIRDERSGNRKGVTV